MERRRVEVSAARDASRRQTVLLTFDKGRDLAEKGEVGRGMHWMLEALRLAGPLEWPEFRATARAGLAAWGEQLVGLRAIVSHDDRVAGVAIAPDGRSFATGSRDGTVRRWDAATGAAVGSPWRLVDSGPARRYPAWPTAPTGRYWRRGGKGPRCASGTRPPAASSPSCRRHPRWTRWLSTPAAAGWPSAAVMGLPGSGTSAPSRCIGPPLKHGDRVEAIAVSPDGKVVVTATGGYGGDHGEARRWEVATGRPLGPPLIFADMARAAAFSPDGDAFVVAAFDGAVGVFDAATQERKGSLPHPIGVGGAAFTPDGTLIVTGDIDGKIRFWDARSLHPVGVLGGHEEQVEGLVIGADGRHLLTSGADRTARLWDLPSGVPRVGPAAAEGASAGGAVAAQRPASPRPADPIGGLPA